MLFQTKLRAAIMTHVDNKIKKAEEAYKAKLETHKMTYEKDLERAGQIHLANQQEALQDSIKEVITGLWTEHK